MTDTQYAVAQALLEIQAVGFTPKNPIKFKSGILSPVYVDNRRLPFFPTQWRIIIQAFQNIITTRNIPHDVVAGVAVGGIPHSATLAYQLQKPSVFIRKEAKEHGKQKRVEGGDVLNLRVLLIEDLVTTGSSSLSAVQSLREEGAIVTDLFAIVSYGFSEATQAFHQSEMTLHTLTSFRIILETAIAQNRFTPEETFLIEDWFRDPYQWGKRNGFA